MLFGTHGRNGAQSQTPQDTVIIFLQLHRVTRRAVQSSSTLGIDCRVRQVKALVHVSGHVGQEETITWYVVQRTSCLFMVRLFTCVLTQNAQQMGVLLIAFSFLIAATRLNEKATFTRGKGG